MEELSAPSPAPPRASSSSRVHQKRQKACDACHRRKIRCNGEEGGPNSCSYCVKNGYECTYNHQPNKWPPSKTYVDGLELRVGELERRVEYLKRELAKARRAAADSTSSDTEDSDWNPRKEEDEDPETRAALNALADGYEDLWLGNPTGMRISQEPRMFHGKSSHFQVVNQQLAEMGSKSFDKDKFFQLRVRPEFRVIDSVLIDEVNLQYYPPAWPEPDLAMLLINAFFERWNSVLPLLHRPTFMRQYADPAMRQDNTWVAVAFGVFAIATKYVDDPRALGQPDAAGHYFYAGIKYWKEIIRVGSPLYAPPSLFRLQALILFTYFLGGQPLFPSSGWALIGLGLRYVQDAGMHLKREWLKRAQAHPFEYEMRKRVFWVLYIMERTMALEMDRSFCMPEQDYDVDLLLELDDAALDLMQQGQENPIGFSHRIASLNVRIRLLQFASHKRDELHMIRHYSGNVHDREVNYLNVVRTRLEHLRGNIHKDLVYKPDQTDREKFLFSSLIHVQYYWVQLILYRPFFSKSKRAAHSQVPVLSISTCASHEIANALNKLRLQNLLVGRIHEASLSGFVAGSVLLMNMWERKNLEGMKEVELCLETLRSLEDRWQFPGLLYDVLRNFSVVMRKVITGHCPTLDWQPPTQANTAVPDCPTCPNQRESANGDSSAINTPVKDANSGPAPIVPPLNSLETPLVSLNDAAQYSNFSLSSSDPFTQPFFSSQLESVFHPSSEGAQPMAAPPNQPMFGEDGWLNDLNFGGHGFMDPQFNEWLNSMLLATQDTTPLYSTTTSDNSSPRVFTNEAVGTTSAADSTRNVPWSFDQQAS
ncbi:hypothetical protein DACRYDRAFT_115214 [Dacryopinax primogenitus]|uniref:Zn(2)-C6 fungal-type domain-containing protein n=1 Tax=Dacryopinax primogenitus (strain DJM 731) TaxID=1858805 RepID=M5G6T5_DACPD|nr:uncharacterized protein DACRYDRAFT_115214 [Dacryopinax primogenitus]EJU03920.1 hypothetical protein DACRYDRAFT_115214 [Dacryopinax primogenitus]